MKGWTSCLTLVRALLMARLLPRIVIVMTLVTAALAVLSSGGKPDEGFRALATSANLVAVTIAAFGAILGAVAVAGDVTSGSLRAVLLRPVGRPAWIAAHAAVLGLFCALLFLVSAGAAALIVALTTGFSDVRLGTLVITAQEAMTGHSIRLLLLALPPLICAPLIGLLVSALCDDVATAVVTSLALVLGPVLFGTMIGELPSWTFADRILHPIAVLGSLAQGVNTQEALVMQGSYAGMALLWSAAWALTALLGAILIFQRRDLKS